MNTPKPIALRVENGIRTATFGKDFNDFIRETKAVSFPIRDENGPATSYPRSF